MRNGADDERGEGVRRLYCILLNTAAALSLALAIAVVVLWVRSYVVTDSIYRTRWWSDGREHNESAWWLFAGRGRVGVAHRRQRDVQPSAALYPHYLAGPWRASWKQTRP